MTARVEQPAGVLYVDPPAAPEAAAAGSTAASRRVPHHRSLVLTIVGVAAVCAVAVFVTRSPVFALRDLTVSGTSHLSTADVARLGHLTDGTNVLWLSPSRLRAQLRRDPWIAAVGIHRSLPGTLHLTIVERRAVAVAQPGRWLVATDGVVIGRAPPRSGLPTIRPGVAFRRGARISEDRLSLTVARGLQSDVRPWTIAVETHRGGQIVLRLRGGGIALLGPADELGQKEAALAGVLGWVHAHGVVARVIDVRAWSTPALTSSPA